MYAEFETHRILIRDRVRTEAFRTALETAVRPGDTVLDVGAGTGILSMLAARAGASKVYAVEQTSIASLAEELVAANGLAEIVDVIQGDIREVELPGKVDVVVSEWLGGFGIDEGMLVPVLTARDRWLEPAGVMVPSLVTAWTALVWDSYLAESVDFFRSDTYGLDLGGLLERTVNEIFYSGPSRHLTPDDQRSESAVLWTTDAARMSIAQAQEPHEAEVRLPIPAPGTANALGLWFSADLAAAKALSIGPGDPPTHWGMTTAPLRKPVELQAGSVARVKFRTELARALGTWSSWAIQIGDRPWEMHDEQDVWREVEE